MLNHKLKVKVSWKGDETAEIWSEATVIDRYLDYKSNGYYGAIESLEARISAIAYIVSKVLTEDQLVTLIEESDYAIVKD